jgi:tellurite resistance protein
MELAVTAEPAALVEPVATEASGQVVVPDKLVVREAMEAAVAAAALVALVVAEVSSNWRPAMAA